MYRSLRAKSFALADLPRAAPHSEPRHGDADGGGDATRRGVGVRGSVAKGVGVCVVPHPDPPTAARRPDPASRLFRHPRSLRRFPFLTRPFPPRRRRRARREQGEDVRRAVQGVQGVPESRERGDCPSTTREQEGDVLGLNEESSMCRVTEKCVPRKRRSARATSAGTPPPRYPRRRTSPPRTPARPCPPPRPR